MNTLTIRSLDTCDYAPIWQAMLEFTDTRIPETQDELWLLQHHPVITQGLAGKAEHILNPHQIPVVTSDRGGQATYHGPGQLMVYTLFDLKRRKISPRQLVNQLEQTIIDFLQLYDISAKRKENAPGVYQKEEKICSIGLRVRKGCSLHGLALNVNMDLTPFSYINPCGFEGLKITQLSAHTNITKIEQIKPQIVAAFLQQFGYTDKIEYKVLPQENTHGNL